MTVKSLIEREENFVKSLNRDSISKEDAISSIESRLSRIEQIPDRTNEDGLHSSTRKEVLRNCVYDLLWVEPRSLYELRENGELDEFMKKLFPENGHIA